jgi:hypothetical protein
LLLEKLINEKHFLIKEKFSLVSRKVFSFYFREKTLSGICEKLKNIILFTGYIKFHGIFDKTGIPEFSNDPKPNN